MKRSKLKEWYGKHKQDVRDFCWYAAGFGAALVSLKIVDKITYTGKSATRFQWNDEGDFEILCDREKRFKRGYDGIGTSYHKDQLDGVVKDFNTMVDSIRKNDQ